MSEMRIIVDHLKLEYNGLFDVKELFNFIDAWWMERGMEKRTTKNFEINSPKGKFIEWQSSTWKKINEYFRYILRVRILMYDLKKVEAMKDKQKVKMSEGKVILYFDGFIEEDLKHRWDETPMFIFFRTLWSKFIFKAYTDWFEHRLIYDVHHLYNAIEQYFNMYKHYRPVSKMPSFYLPFEP